MAVHASLYKTARWKHLRVAALHRHRGRCQACGIQCRGNGQRDRTAAVVDHITPHRGDETLFYDEANLQVLCKACHDGGKQRHERRGYSTSVGLDGWPLDPQHPANKGRL